MSTPATTRPGKRTASPWLSGEPTCKALRTSSQESAVDAAIHALKVVNGDSLSAEKLGFLLHQCDRIQEEYEQWMASQEAAREAAREASREAAREEKPLPLDELALVLGCLPTHELAMAAQSSTHFTIAAGRASRERIERLELDEESDGLKLCSLGRRWNGWLIWKGSSFERVS